MKILRFAKSYMKKYLLLIIFFLVLSIVFWAINISIPYITGRYIDLIYELKNIKVIYYFTVIIFAIVLLNSIMSYLSSITYVKMQSKIAFDMNYDFLEYVKKLPFLYFKDVDSIYLSHRINGDCNTLVTFLINNIANLFTKAITFVFAIFILFRINIKLASILMLLVPLYLILYTVFKKPLYKYGYELKEKQNKFFSDMSNQLLNMKYIKINVMFEVLGNQLKKGFSAVYKSLLKQTRVSFLFSSCDTFTSGIFQIILFFFGGIEIINGKLTIGEFTIINSYFAMIMGTLTYFLNFGKSYQEALVSYERLSKILENQLEGNGTKLIEGIEEIELKEVSFSYNNAKIIEGLNYKFEKGKIYIVTGENGVGKSTLLTLIIGLLNGNCKGSIIYNSIDSKELDLYHVRKNLVGYTDQEPVLMNDTILNNLTYELNDIGEATVLEWCRRVNLEQFIISQKSGINSIINEKSSNVSGGEKQKLSLAKIFIKNPDVIILDEPTSALDSISIGKIKEILLESKKDKIIIMVTHDRDMISIADEVIPLKNVKIPNWNNEVGA